MPGPTQGQRWYPTKQQLSDPTSLERTLRQVLSQHYALQDKYDAMAKKAGAGAASHSASADSPLPGHGPSDTQLCGLYVAPVDTQTMANGATLKYNKATGNFSFQ